MAKLPYGYNPLKAQTNVDDLRYDDPTKYFFYRFDIELLTRARELLTISRDHLILDIRVRILQHFDGGGVTEFYLGTVEDFDSIVRFDLAFQRTYRGFEGKNNTDFLNIFDSDKRIFASMKQRNQVAVSTRGSGWVLIRYIDLGLVRGYT